MQYLDLMQAVELMMKSKERHITSLNCDESTNEWIEHNFSIKDYLGIPPYPGLFGTPVKVVEYLRPGFMEAEMSDGTRKIVNLHRKNEEPNDR